MKKQAGYLLAAMLLCPMIARADPEIAGGVALVMLGFCLLSLIACTISLSKFYHGARAGTLIGWTIASFILIGFYFLSVALFFDDRVKYGFVAFHIELAQKGKWFLPVMDGLFVSYGLYVLYRLFRMLVEDARS